MDRNAGIGSIRRFISSGRLPALMPALGGLALRTHLRRVPDATLLRSSYRHPRLGTRGLNRRAFCAWRAGPDPGVTVH